MSNTDINVNFIMVDNKNDLENKLIDGKNPLLSGIICFIKDENNPELAIFDENGQVRYIKSSSSFSEGLKLNNNSSLYLNSNNEKQNIMKAINLNQIENKTEKNKEHLSFSAGEGLTQEIGTVSLGAYYKNFISLTPLTQILKNNGSPASIEYTGENDGNQASMTTSTPGDTETLPVENTENSTEYETNVFKYIGSISEVDQNNLLGEFSFAFIYKNSDYNQNNSIPNEYHFTKIEKIDLDNNNGYNITLVDEIPWEVNSDEKFTLIGLEVISSESNHRGSISLGQGLKTTSNNGVFLGKFNQITDGTNNFGSNFTFVVGSGTGPEDSLRRNSIEITNDGVINFKGPKNNTSLAIKSINDTDKIIINDFTGIGIYTNNTYTSLSDYIDTKVKAKVDQLSTPEINQYMSPVIIGPPIDKEEESKALLWIKEIYNKTDNGCLWLDTRIGNGVLKRPYRDIEGNITWIPVSSAYT